MRKLRVYGVAEVGISTVIEVSDNASFEEIINTAYEKFGGIHNFVGNGGTDKLIGVNGNDTIDCSYSEVEFAPQGEDDIEDI